MDVMTYALLKRRIDALDPKTIYGVTWDKSANPTLTRTDAAVGMVAEAGVDGQLVCNDFDQAAIYRDIHEVVDALGNVFVRIPKFYIRKTDTGNCMTWQISRFPHPGFYLPWCFWDFTNQRELPYIDVGKYKATLSPDGKLESKPGGYPLVNANIVQFRDYARANGKGYQQLDIHVVDVLQTLFYVEFATLNSQAIMQGFTTGRYGAESDVAVVSETGTNRIIVSNATASNYRVGQAISVGTSQYGTQVFYGRTITAIEDYDTENKAIAFDGDSVDIAVGNLLQNTGWKNGFSSQIAASSGSIVSNTDGKYPCVYRGIESPWGDIWQYVDGVNINEFQAWVARNADEYASNVFAHPYESLAYVNCNTDGYASQMGHDSALPFAEFPVAVGGSSTTYYSDYCSLAAGRRVARVGGYWGSGSVAGLSCWFLNASSSYTYSNLGGRLIKKPL